MDNACNLLNMHIAVAGFAIDRQFREPNLEWVASLLFRCAIRPQPLKTAIVAGERA